MRRGGKFKLIRTACKRCGKPISTGNRSLFGMNAAKEKLGGICEDCITPEERQEIEQTMRGAMPAAITDRRRA